MGLGLHPRTVARQASAGRLEQLYPGVYRVGGSPPTWRQGLFAACAWAGGPPERWPSGARTVASHRAAARLHGLDGFEEAAVEVTAARRPQFAGCSFLAHYATPDPDSVVLVDGIPATSMARTLVDLAAVLPPDECERALDDALRRNKVSEMWLRYVVTHVTGPGCRGARAMQRLLDGRDPLDGPSASAFQKSLRRLLLGAGFPMVEEYQVPGLRYRCDLGTDRYMAVVEADSKKHHSGRQDWAADKARENEIVAGGYVMLKFTPDDLKKRRPWILKTVEQTLRSRGWPGPPEAVKASSSGGARSRTG